MAINLDKQVLNINKLIAKNTQIVWLEQDILVPDTKPDVMKVIGVNAIPMISNIEVLDGLIKVNGEVVYYIIYRSAENDETKGISMTYPFAQNINEKDAKQGMHARVKGDTRNIIFSSPNERKISIKTELVLKYELDNIQSIELIKNIDSEGQIEFLKKEDMVSNVVGTKVEVIDANEDIVLSDSEMKIQEILRINAKIINPEYKVSYNKILPKGEIEIQILYIGTDGMLNTKVVEIPFSGMIEFENIKEDSKFDIKYNLRNLEVTVNEDGSMINVSSEILADAVMYEETKLEYISDFYSTNKNLKYNTQDVAIIKSKDKVEKQINIKETIGNIEPKAKIINSMVDSSYITTKVTGGNLYLGGNLKVDVLIDNGNGNALEKKPYDIDINEAIPLGKEIDEKYVDVEIKINKQSITNMSGNLEAMIGLNLVINMYNVDKIIVVGDVEEQDINELDFSSMYMYIVKKGDTLWDIAKKYKTSVSKIVNINNIEDENSISIGQKILIIR